MNKHVIAAIIPAFNEAENIGRVLSVILHSGYFDEVIVVDDASRDATGEVARNLGAKVIRLQENGGKAHAMRTGVNSTKAEIIAFFDADSLGLTHQHIADLLKPLQDQQVAMSEGIRDRWMGLPWMMEKLFPVMFGICGERAIRRDVLMDIPEKFIFNMTGEIVMNYYCKVNRLPVVSVKLPGLDVIVKEKKWGLARGLRARFFMVVEFIKVRYLIALHREEFNKRHV